jgi:phage shock protein A
MLPFSSRASSARAIPGQSRNGDTPEMTQTKGSSMFRLVRIWWRYTGTKLHLMQQEHADPKVQLEQAIIEAREQHRRLRDQAANVIANYHQSEARLARAATAQQEADASARRALMLAEREIRAGNDEKAGAFGEAAESFAAASLDREREVRELEQIVLQSSAAAERAKRAVEQNATMLHKRLAEREQLLSTLDRAKLQEQMNKALATLDDPVGDIVPTIAEVQKKIEDRLARAQSVASLNAAAGAIDATMLEVEAAGRRADAGARISLLRAQLGLAPAPEGEARVRPIKAIES